MSDRATKSRIRGEEFTQLILNGVDYDCDPGVILKHQRPALWVKGGTLVEKRLCVLGNISTESFLSGNIMSDLILVDTIQEKTPGDGVVLVGNLIATDSTFFVDRIEANSLSVFDIENVETISSDGDLAICSGGDITLKALGGDIIAANATITTDALNADVANITQINDLETICTDTDLLIKTAGNIDVNGARLENVDSLTSMGDMTLCPDGDLVLKPGGNLVVNGGSLDVDLTNLTGVCSISGKPGSDLELSVDDGFFITIVGGDGIDMQGRELRNLGNLTLSGVDSGTITTGNVVSEGDLSICAAPGSDLLLKGDTVRIESSTFVLDPTTIDLSNNVIGNVGKIEVAQIDSNPAGDDLCILTDVIIKGTLTAENLTGNVTSSDPAAVFRVDSSGTQVIASNVAAELVTILTVEHPLNMNVPGTWNGTDTFTVSRAGWYSISAAIDFGDNISNKFSLQVFVNGSGVDCFGQNQLFSTGLAALAHLECKSYLDEGDTVDLRVSQTTNDPQTLERAYLSLHFLPGTAGAVVQGNVALLDVGTVCVDNVVQTNSVEPKSGDTVTVNGDLAADEFIGGYNTAAGTDAGVTIPDGTTVFVLTAGSETGTFTLTGPTASAGQLIFIRNNAGQTTSGDFSLTPSTGAVFAYDGSSWVVIARS